MSRATSPSYWHGGHPGLPAGGLILPPSATGAEHTLGDYMGRRERIASGYRSSRVYVTTQFRAALLYAVLHPSRRTHGCGHVYLVEPIGELTHDPDVDAAAAGFSFSCESARILRVVEPSRALRREAERAVRKLLKRRQAVRS